MKNENCPACSGLLCRDIGSWHACCARCAYESADLPPAINSPDTHENIDETARETGLRELRQHNFRLLLKALTKLKPNGGRLLEVGCAHGWFLEAAMKHFEVLGIEPDQTIYNVAMERNLPIQLGYFPDALADQERFDVIIFNDVFEHIPDCEEILRACHQWLYDDGVIVLNLPSSDGIFYRTSKVFRRLGYDSFFNRLWQKDMPSPHLHYFNANNLVRLLTVNKFIPIEIGRLPVLSLSGLYTRISYAGNLSTLSRAIVYACAALALPALRILPSDIIYTIAEKRKE